MAYLHEDQISDYVDLFGHVIRSFNKYWLLAPLALPVIGAFMLFGKRHKQGSYWVPSWCARWVRYASFDPYSEYCAPSPNDDRSLWMSHNMMRRRCPPGYSYEVRRIVNSDQVFFHRFPDWPRDGYTNPERTFAFVGKLGAGKLGDVVWSGVVPPHRTPWKDIEWTQES